MKKNSQYTCTKFHSFGSCHSFWNFKLYFWCCCLKYCFVFLCGEHNSNCVHFCASFHWRFSANNALCQDLVNIPEGSAPGTLRPLMIKPQVCCVPCSTRIGSSSYSLHHRVYHKSSTPVKQTAWRSWAHWPIQKVETYLGNHRQEALSSFLFPPPKDSTTVSNLVILIWEWSFSDSLKVRRVGQWTRNIKEG